MHHASRPLFALACTTGALLAALAATPAEAGGRFAVRGHDGAAVGAVRHGPNGGGFARGRAISGDGQGNGRLVSGGAFRGPNGGSGARAGETTRAADGSLNHRSGFQASNANGSVSSQGSATRSANGEITQSRTTTATGAAGNTYNGSTSYSKETGVVHSGSCTDAAGTAIPCR